MTLLLSLYLARHPDLTVDPASARRHVTALLLLIPSQAIGSQLSRRQPGLTQPV